MNVIKKLRIVLNSRQKHRVALLCVLITFSALLETLSVTVILPLISAVVSPDTILGDKRVVNILSAVGIVDPDPGTFVRILLLVTMGIFVFKNVYLFFLTVVQSRFISNARCFTSIRLMGDYLNKPYEFYLNADTAVVQRSITDCQQRYPAYI